MIIKKKKKKMMYIIQYIYCNGANEMRAMQIHMQAFIHRHGQDTGRVEQQQIGMAWARHKSTPVNRRSRSEVNVIPGAKQREIIQVHDNSPGRGEQSPNDKTRERSRAEYKLQGRQRSDKKQDTQARIKTQLLRK